MIVKFIKYNPSTIVVTDGTDKILKSAPKELPQNCKTALLPYGSLLPNEKPFDIIVGSDLIYGGNYFSDLCYTIKHSLSLHGTCYLFYINRGDELLDLFINEVKKASMTIHTNKIDSSYLLDHKFEVYVSNQMIDDYFMITITHNK